MLGRSRRRRLFTAVGVGVVFGTVGVLFAAALGASASSAGWSAPVHLDSAVNLTSVSCPTSSFCVAVTADGKAFTYNGTRWSGGTSFDSQAAVGNGVRSVSCPSSSFCAAVDSAGDALTYSGTSWSSPTLIDSSLENQLNSVSCPTSSFCVAVDESGNASVFNGSSWSAPEAINDDYTLNAVSCPSASFCAAGGIGFPSGFLAGAVLTFNGHIWSAPTTIDSSLYPITTSVSCSNSSFCVAVADDGSAFKYNGSAWSAPTSIDPSNPHSVSLSSVSCPTAAFCMAVDTAGNALTFNGTSWSARSKIVNGGFSLNSVSCPTSSFCAAVDNGGWALTYSSQRTQTHIFDAFTAAGKAAIHVTRTARGSCFTGALAVNRNDAWRCISGNTLYDPCFSSKKAKGVVLCPSAPWKTYAVKLKLTKRLPKPDPGKPSTSGLPWAIKTTSGMQCVMDTGATKAIGKVRANYGCVGSQNFLWGSPSRSSEPWTIYSAPLKATKLTQRVSISVAWF